MVGPKPQPVILWETREITCRCLTLAPDHIEITLCLDRFVIERVVFTDHERASAYAIAKMRAYKAV